MINIAHLFRKLLIKIRGGVVKLYPEGNPRGNVLLSYITEPFLRPNRSSDFHTNIWECREIAYIFLRKGYAVDVIDWNDYSFVPNKEYAYFVDIQQNLERLAPFVGKHCMKIFHCTGAYWKFQNHAERTRIKEIKERRGVDIIPRRLQKEIRAAETADVITMLGNKFTEDTYAFAKKEIFHIPISTTHIYPSPEMKDFEYAKTGFVWFGGAGMAHKGLDLVLEAFANMPEYRLSICGNVSMEKDFEKAYQKELYETPNIKTFGKIDPGGPIFRKIIETSVAMIFPSCSEGGGGSVVTAMHAGLIPIVSYESSVDIGDYGVILKACTVESISNDVRKMVSFSANELRTRSIAAWHDVNIRHTRKTFSETFTRVVEELEKRR